MFLLFEDVFVRRTANVKYTRSIYLFIKTSNIHNNKCKKILIFIRIDGTEGEVLCSYGAFGQNVEKVDFPTFGTPTMPTRKLVPTRPIRGFFSGS